MQLDISAHDLGIYFSTSNCEMAAVTLKKDEFNSM
jgi:hypothetical protein